MDRNLFPSGRRPVRASPPIVPPSKDRSLTDFLRYYDRRGKQISLRRWAQLFEDVGYRFLADHYIESYRVATIWDGGLAADIVHVFHGFPPTIFETMIFHYNDPHWDTPIVRYWNEAEARAGHLRAVAWLMGELRPLGLPRSLPPPPMRAAIMMGGACVQAQA